MLLSRRQVLGYGAGGLLGLGVAGCGAVGQPDLRVANWGAAGDDSELAKTIRLLFEEFERSRGIDLQVESIPGGEYVSKMLLNFVAGAEPDVMQLDASSAAMFIDNGVLADLNGLGEGDGDFDWGDYWENTVAIGERGQRRYAVPLDFTPMVMYYNRAHFAAAGVREPSGTWTWEEFLGAARELTRDGRYGFGFANWMPGWVMWLWNNGGDVLADRDGEYWATGALDSEQNAEAVGWLRDLIVKEKVAPSLGQMAALGVDPFQNGDASMTVSGHWAMVGYAESDRLDMDEIGIMPLPYAGHLRERLLEKRAAAEPTKSSLPRVLSDTVIYESGLAVGRRSKNPELAWEFVKMMTSRETQERVQTTGLAVCGRRDVAGQIAQGDEREQMFLEIVPTGRVPWGAVVQGYDFVETEGTKMMDAVLKTGAGPAAALREAARSIDRYFAERRA